MYPPPSPFPTGREGELISINFYYFCSMFLIDTHTHLYLDAFNEDRDSVVERAIDHDIQIMLLPNIDSTSIDSMHALCQQFPKNCFPMMGLHPTSVKENWIEEMETVEYLLGQKRYVAVGETGIDLYWDNTFVKEQEIVFRKQVDLAIKYDLPIVIHSRESIDILISILEDYNNTGLRGVFHCFTGTIEQAEKIIEMDFLLGIGGVLTFKNSILDQIIKNIDLSYIVLETDAPFLAPVPYRGKRNESAYIKLIAQRLAEVKNINIEDIAQVTTYNARELFNI